MSHAQAQLFAIYTHLGSLKNDGRLIINVPAYQWLYSARDQSIGHYKRYSLHELHNKLTRAGFKVIKARYWNMIGFFPYLIIEKAMNQRIKKNKYIIFAKTIHGQIL